VLSVLHVISRMPPWGTELQLAGLLKSAHGVHWDATLCVLHPGFPLTQEVRDAGVPVIELDGTSRIHLDRFRDLRRLARSGRYDVVHSSLWGASAFARLAVAGPGRPAVVMTEQRVEDFRPRRRRAADRLLRNLTEEWTGNSRDVCTFIVRAHNAPPARVHLLRNAVDTDVFHPPAQRVPRDSDRPRIGTLGRLIHQKGLDVLVDAVRLVVRELDVQVEIAGEGELRAELERAATGLPVTFLGRIDGPRAVADYLRSLDLYVMPSRYEGLPNAMLEALACGLPVVATDAPGMAEATEHRVHLVAPDDPHALARAIVAALDRPTASEPSPWPSFDEAAAAHLEVFEKALRRHRSRDTERVSAERHRPAVPSQPPPGAIARPGRARPPF
jgi:glycosyltransferase involved in cell wall biosynthesis